MKNTCNIKCYMFSYFVSCSMPPTLRVKKKQSVKSKTPILTLSLRCAIQSSCNNSDVNVQKQHFLHMCKNCNNKQK